MVYIKTNTFYPQRLVSHCGDLQGGEGWQMGGELSACLYMQKLGGGSLQGGKPIFPDDLGGNVFLPIHPLFSS